LVKELNETYRWAGFVGGIFFSISFISWYFMDGIADKSATIYPVNLVNGAGIVIGILIFVAISYIADICSA
jgi:hypothetical protein